MSELLQGLPLPGWQGMWVPEDFLRSGNIIPDGEELGNRLFLLIRKV
jgi:hypothetical protein